MLKFTLINLNMLKKTHFITQKVFNVVTCVLVSDAAKNYEILFYTFISSLKILIDLILRFIFLFFPSITDSRKQV